MSKFRVGQRVRIKWSECWPQLNGTCGYIKSKTDGRSGPNGWVGDWNVVPDGHRNNLLRDPTAPTGFSYFCPVSEQLEPATDCYDKTEWDACVWKPEHLRVSA